MPGHRSAVVQAQGQRQVGAGFVPIEAAGFIDLGAGAAICRFYTADDGFIQVSTTGGYGPQNIDDIKLFVFEQTHSIGSQQAADQWAGDQGFIGQSSFLLNDQTYRRAWDGTDSSKVSPVKVLETVHSKDTNIAPYDVDHLMMLYQRTLRPSDRQEYVLTSLEFTGEDEAAAVVSVGVDLERSSMTVM